MLVLFALTTIIHFLQAVRYRMWFMLWTAILAGILECVGWAGRLWSAYNVLASTAYTMQIVCTIIGPTPLIAANFVILGHVIRRLGQQYSRLSARWYTIIFVSCDVIALVVQAIGGAAAASAANNGDNPSAGADIMLAGIIFQTAAITLYILFAVEFFSRYFYDKPLGGRANVKTGYLFEGKLRQMVVALIFSSLVFYVRTWYRCIELGDGWHGRIIRTERYFVIMDALMIVLAMWTLNIFHPGRLLGYGAEWSADKTIVMQAMRPQDSEATIGMAWSENRAAAKEQY